MRFSICKKIFFFCNYVYISNILIINACHILRNIKFHPADSLSPSTGTLITGWLILLYQKIVYLIPRSTRQELWSKHSMWHDTKIRRKETASFKSILTKLSNIYCAACFGLAWPSQGTHWHFIKNIDNYGYRNKILLVKWDLPFYVIHE